jgi:CO/xanthine dehydrogenase Mo-binding subunit
LAESPASVDPAAGNQVGESDAAAPVALAAGRPVKPRSTREPSGRERHAEKITVYLSADELVHLDEAKSALYRDHGLKVDRGRIVREAVAVVVGDLAAKGEASILTRRLRER